MDKEITIKFEPFTKENRQEMLNKISRGVLAIEQILTDEDLHELDSILMRAVWREDQNQENI